MAGKAARLALSRKQILAFRRRVGSLEERLPAGTNSLRRAAWAGLQDSMPRAALLSMHARVKGIHSSHWEHSSLVQIWGPRFSNYVVAAKDLAVFTLGRLPSDGRARARAIDTAERLEVFLKGRRMPFGEAGRALRVPPNSLRYATATGRLLLHWDGARQPDVWMVPAPALEAGQARLELARRYLRVFAPVTIAGFAKWAGIRPGEARLAFEALTKELTAVRSPVGEGWILADDEKDFHTQRDEPSAAVRLLPSGDAYFLLWGADRELLVPDARRRAALWTTRVWPGALLMNGEIVGVWRRAGGTVVFDTWRRLTAVEREAVEAEALSLPLPGLNNPIAVCWNS